MIKYFKYILPVLFGIFLMSESVFATSQAANFDHERLNCGIGGLFLIYSNDIISIKNPDNYNPNSVYLSPGYKSSILVPSCINPLNLYIGSPFFYTKLPLWIFLLINGLLYFLFRFYRKRKQQPKNESIIDGM